MSVQTVHTDKPTTTRDEEIKLGGAGVSKLIHYNKVEKGGHFAAWEQPQLFSEEVRAGFKPLRK